ncbi:MAG TPA: cobalamin-binding protein [Bryobacteraceae bacterium]|nr:cobalamin-binding protein [Bryobacteraceae bacterium]
MRIVSLIASATEIVHALDLGQFQVGRSHECDFPPEVRALPVCTKPGFSLEGTSADIDRRVKEKLATALSVYEVFEDVLERLAPTHIITQTQCEVCAVSLKDVERALCGVVSSQPKLVSLQPNALADIWDDIRRVAGACEVSDRGAALVAGLQERMQAISCVAKTGRRKRVACIEWQEPLMAAGNWVPELVELAGGENLFGTAGAHSPWMDFEQLVAAGPDVIVVTPCGYDLEETRAEMYWLTQDPLWKELRAEVYLADGNQFMNRPGPRVVESLQIFTEILHPDLFSPQLCESGAWEPWGGR